MPEVFVDCTTWAGQQRIRTYVMGWLERLDYAGRLERGWPVDELAHRVWERVQQDFEPVWDGPIVDNVPLAVMVAAAMVEDYFAAYPERRRVRYAVRGPLPDHEFRRCVLDFVHDLEEFEPGSLPETPEDAAAAFWSTVAESPIRWGCSPERGPLVDDEPRAREVAVEAIREYFDTRRRAQRRRRRSR
jgi:hypothetical protein